MSSLDPFSPSWILTEPDYNDSIELYHCDPVDDHYTGLHIKVQDTVAETESVIILTKLQATAVRNRLTRMIEAMP